MRESPCALKDRTVRQPILAGSQFADRGNVVWLFADEILEAIQASITPERVRESHHLICVARRNCFRAKTPLFPAMQAYMLRRGRLFRYAQPR